MMFLSSLLAMLAACSRARATPPCFDGLLDELFEAWPLEPDERAGSGAEGA